jgi:hypothetical protein
LGPKQGPTQFGLDILVHPTCPGIIGNGILQAQPRVSNCTPPSISDKSGLSDQIGMSAQPDPQSGAHFTGEDS